MSSRTAVKALCIVRVSSHSFGVRIVHHLFFCIPYSIRNVLINFEKCSQSDQPVGKPDHPDHYVLFSGIVVRALCLVWIGSHSFGVEIVHYFFFLGSLLCEECSEIFLDFFSTGLSGWGTRSTGSFGFFPGIAVRASWLVSVGSQSSELKIMHHLFF